jgi:hypothetical protein
MAMQVADLAPHASCAQAERERMAPHMRSRVAVLHSSASGLERTIEVVPLHKLSGDHRTQVVDRALKTKDMNNEHFLRTVRERLDRCSASHTCLVPSHTCMAACCYLSFSVLSVRGASSAAWTILNQVLLGMCSVCLRP